MRQLDGLLKRALEIPVPADRGVMPLPRDLKPKTAPQRWFALAASVLLAIALGAVWLASPQPSLAAAVVDHVQHEPDAMVATESRVTADELSDVLHRAGMRLKSGARSISIARTCLFRGSTIPHLVVQTREGPITVLVLPREHVESAQHFAEEGYQGTILPSGPGAIAIITASGTVLEAAAAQVAAEVEWVND